MTSGAAWNTRPFRPETLEAAREAARRSGLSLGTWLDSAILDTATDAGVRARRREQDPEDIGLDDEALTLVSERLDELARRIDRLTKGGSAPDSSRSETAPTRVAPDVKTSLHALEARLTSALREPVPQRQAVTQPLADVIRDLNSRLDRLGTIAAALGDISEHPAAIRTALRVPDEDRAQTQHPADPAAGLTSALAEIAGRQRELDAETAGAHDFARLEQQLRHITEQIETLRGPAETAEAAATREAERANFQRLESKILELAQKLDASDARLDGLETIERSIADLIFQLKETRAAAVEEAEQAARAIGREMLSDSGRTVVEVDALRQELTEFRASQAEIDRRTEDTLAAVHHTLERLVERAVEIDALKQELTDFRASHAEIDSRTEDGLEAVHHTLERLVERLASIETGVRAGGPIATEPQEARVVSQSGAALASIAPLRPSAPKPAPEQAPIAPDLPADYPLEPGSGAPHGSASSSATRIAASEAVPANPAAAEPAAKANFIAAARRAAQAAAVESTEPPGAAGARSQAGGGIAAVVAHRRRPLMIAAGVLLVGAGSVHIAMTGDLLPLPGLKTSARIEAPASAPEETLSAVGTVKPATAPAPGQSRAGRAPDPLVPDTGASGARLASGPTGNEFLLSPVPHGSVNPADSQARESIPSKATPTPTTAMSEVTGSLAPAQATAATLASPRPVPETVPNPAGTLPSGVGNATLRSAALAGNPAAEYDIGIRFSEGRGAPQSFEEAAHWLARAAEHGLAPAQYRLGSLYEKGQGVKKDLVEARRLYLAAAQQGNAKAMHNLAVLYAVGFESGPDYKTASEWFQKAADHGVADSQYNLGILYARGVGVEQNLPESYKWFALAAQQGDKDAAKKRDEVAARLDPQALVAARLAVQTWTADPEPEAATKVEPPGSDLERALPVAPSPKSKPGRRTGASGSA